MYGMPGNRFGNMIEVSNPNEMPELVKEAQVAGKPARAFIVGSKELSLSFDGMFLVDTSSGEVVEEDTFAMRRIFTPVLS
jgi:hypothetical protein